MTGCIHLVHSVNFYFCENLIKLYSYFTDIWDTLTSFTFQNQIKFNCTWAINLPAMVFHKNNSQHRNPTRTHHHTHKHTSHHFTHSRFTHREAYRIMSPRSKPDRRRVVQFAVPVASVSGPGHTSRPRLLCILCHAGWGGGGSMFAQFRTIRGVGFEGRR